jgi:D-alanyl-D-alanine carboxypeptidase/D-alanyl-D-alanine-endopeptidase (penicillin-binding protein 4)
MDDGRFGPGWSWDDYSYYYSAEKSAMPVYGNMFWVVKDSLSENLDLLPEAFRPNVVLKIDSTLDYYNYARNEYFNEFTLTLNGREKHFEETIPFKTHEETAVRLLEDTLRRPIAMRSSLAGCPWTMKRSQPIDTLMKHMLIPSDNFLAEQIMLMCSGLLSDTLNSRKAMRFVHEKYLPQLQNKLIWRDGSGLSRYNKVTPAGMVHLLEQLWWDVEEDRLFSLLPANGVRGTLRRSFPSDVPYIFAKTGSLSYVYCLSGYVKCRSGKTMAFSFMNNNYALPTSVVKAEMAKVLEAIRDQY